MNKMYRNYHFPGNLHTANHALSCRTQYGPVETFGFRSDDILLHYYYYDIKICIAVCVRGECAI